MRELRICLVLEGCYPYVHGGVSTWMHQYITVMKEHEFVLWVIGAHACDRGKFVYELPDNVVEVHEVFLDDALKLKEHGNQNGQLHRVLYKYLVAGYAGYGRGTRCEIYRCYY